MAQDKLLRLRDAAERLALKPGTLRIWLRDGLLPGIKLGREWRVRVSDLETILQAGGGWVVSREADEEDVE